MLLYFTMCCCRYLVLVLLSGTWYVSWVSMVSWCSTQLFYRRLFDVYESLTLRSLITEFISSFMVISSLLLSYGIITGELTKQDSNCNFYNSSPNYYRFINELCFLSSLFELIIEDSYLILDYMVLAIWEPNDGAKWDVCIYDNWENSWEKGTSRMVYGFSCSSISPGFWSKFLLFFFFVLILFVCLIYIRLIWKRFFKY